MVVASRVCGGNSENRNTEGNGWRLLAVPPVRWSIVSAGVTADWLSIAEGRSRHLHPRRLPAAPSNLAVRSDQPLSNSSHQPPSIQTPRLDGSLLIAAHWTVRATHSKFPTPPIETSITAMLHFAPCPSPDTPVQALHGVEHTIVPPLWSWL
jgi:hypothetical protein